MERERDREREKGVAQYRLGLYDQGPEGVDSTKGISAKIPSSSSGTVYRLEAIGFTGKEVLHPPCLSDYQLCPPLGLC